jgi:hypothetical protein
MTIEHKPESNGRTASGHTYERPHGFEDGQVHRHRRARGMLRLLAPLMLALALLIVFRGLAEAPAE